MPRRRNGSGSLYRRNGWYYAKMTIKDKPVRMALGTREKSEAVSRLNNLSKGYDLSPEERLAALAVHLKPQNERRSFDEAWEAYCTAPENVSQSPGARMCNAGMWRGLMTYLHGHHQFRIRENCEGHYTSTDCLDDIDEKIAGEFVTWLRAHRSAETCNKYLRVLKRVWSLNGVESNPWARFRKLPVECVQRRALTQEETDLLIDKAEGEMKTLFVIGVYTGMRMSDCQHLRWESITGDMLLVRTSKTKRLAGIPIHPALRAALGKPKKKGPVLPGLYPLDRWRVSDAVRMAVIDAMTTPSDSREMDLAGEVSVASAAAYLRMSRTTLWRMCSRGDVSAVRRGKKFYIAGADVARLKSA